jgi:D-alanine transaminase
MNDPIVYLNGQWLPLEDASIPVMDRGFIFGDGIYEVVPVYQGVLFRWDEHYARLEKSLAKVQITNPYTKAQWTDIVMRLFSLHTWPDQYIYLHITRGVAKRDHAFPKQATPTVFAMANELVPIPDSVRAAGVRAHSMPDTRWLHCDIKSISLLGNVLARQAAVDAHAYECIMFRDGFMTEGAASNIWVVKNNTLLSPLRDEKILKGIRIDLVDSLCKQAGINFEVRPITKAEVFAADELMLSSATKEVLPITHLDDNPVGNGKVGPVYAKLYTAYQTTKQNVIAAAKK